MIFAALNAPGPQIDLSIEGMRSQRFGVGVFFLLMLGIVLFVGIMIAVLKGSGQEKITRPGERWMFAAIILGVVAAVIFASVQMLSGVLF